MSDEVNEEDFGAFDDADSSLLEEKTAVKIPIFEGDLPQVIYDIVGWVDKTIARKIWPNADLEARFGKRSAYEILEDGHTHYMGPCADLTQVTFEAVKRNVSLPSFIIEELREPWLPFNRLHMAVEFIFGGDKYFLDFEKQNRVIFGKGSYTNSNGQIKSIKILRVPEERMSPMEPLHVNLGFSSPEELGDMFTGYSFRVPLERMKADNTKRTYTRFLRIIGGDDSFVIVDRTGRKEKYVRPPRN